MCKEFTSNISYFLVLLVVFDCFIKVLRVLLAHFHEVYTDAVVSKGLAVDISNRATNLQELFVLINC